MVHAGAKRIGATLLRSLFPCLAGTDSGAKLERKLEPVCTDGLSAPVWDRSRTDPLSFAQGLSLLPQDIVKVITKAPKVETNAVLNAQFQHLFAITFPEIPSILAFS